MNKIAFKIGYMSKKADAVSGRHLAFLKANQPLPPDAQLTKQHLDSYDAARKYFLKHPDPRAVPLILNSFGEGSGSGVYQMMSDVLRKLPPEKVTPVIRKALQSKYPGVRNWNTQIAAEFPDPSYRKSLTRLLKDKNPDVQFHAQTALDQIPKVSAEMDIYKLKPVNSVRKAREALFNDPVKRLAWMQNVKQGERNFFKDQGYRLIGTNRGGDSVLQGRDGHIYAALHETGDIVHLKTPEALESVYRGFGEKIPLRAQNALK